MVGMTEKLENIIDKKAEYYSNAKWDDSIPEYEQRVSNAIESYNKIGFMIDMMYTNGIIGDRVYSEVSYYYYNTRTHYNIPNHCVFFRSW